MRITIGGASPHPELSNENNVQELLGNTDEGLVVTNFSYQYKVISLQFSDKRYIVPAAQLIIAISALYGQEYVSSALR